MSDSGQLAFSLLEDTDGPWDHKESDATKHSTERAALKQHPRPHPPDKDGGYDGTDMIFSIIFSGRELPEVHTRGIFHVQSPLTSLSYCLIGQLHDLGED